MFIKILRIIIAVWTGLEPATPCVTGRYSNQLNYQTYANILYVFQLYFTIQSIDLYNLLKNFIKKAIQILIIQNIWKAFHWSNY